MLRAAHSGRPNTVALASVAATIVALPATPHFPNLEGGQENKVWQRLTNAAKSRYAIAYQGQDQVLRRNYDMMKSMYVVGP